MSRAVPAKGHYGGRGIVLDITEEIITNGTQRDSSHCIVAEALKAAVPNAQFIAVDLQSIRFTDPDSGRRYIYLTPEWAQRHLVDFDQGVRPEPTSRRLGNPAQILMSGDRRKTSKKRRPNARPLPVSGKDVVQENHSTVVLGGKAPPTAALSNSRGRRRSFGLRLSQR